MDKPKYKRPELILVRRDEYADIELLYFISTPEDNFVLYRPQGYDKFLCEYFDNPLI